MSLRVLAVLAAAGALLAGCGGPPFSEGVATGAPFDGGIPYPGPGNEVEVDFASLEPNDTPAEATALGSATMGDLVVWVGSNEIGGAANPANYFVFESAPTVGELEFNMCYMGAVTGMTATLWKVANGVQEKPPVATWTVTDTCANNFTAPLLASTTYLFGMEATGGPGSYTA